MHCQETLFELEAMPHIDTLFRTALRATGNRGVAEDVTQETYLQAWKSFDRYQPGTNCRAWLFKILFHVVHHHRRRAAQHTRRFVADADWAVEELAAFVEPVPEAIRDEEILGALDRLPDVYRDVLLLVDVESFSYKEAAEALGVPIGTVMSRLSRGRGLLRGELAPIAVSFGIAAAGAARPGA
jgi:RNA polymerase sigma-70 factor (ECF subfamily)